MNHQSSHPRGFSLVEVLIAVMILSLGLLGLAAVFPVIIRQQRLAGDATQGLIVAKSAEAYFRSNGPINRPSISTAAIPAPQQRRGLDLWRFEGIVNAGDVPSNATYREIEVGQVHLPQIWDTRSFLSATPPIEGGLVCERTAADRGDNYIFGYGLLAPSNRQFEEPMISLRDRLWPAAYSAMDEHWQESKYANEPRFVWDVALMRDDNGTPHDFVDDKARVAVVVRRIDSGMRIPSRDVEDDFFDPLAQNNQSQRPSAATGQFRGVRLGDVLLCNTGAVNERNRTRLLSDDEFRVPVAVDATSGNLADKMPTLDGKGNYAALQTVFVAAFEDPESNTGSNFSRLVFQPGLSPARLTMLRQPNQRFADNLGNVYLVIRVDDTNPNAVIISPPAPASARDMALVDPQAVQILYSPTPPAAISIFTIEAP